jgi:pimeloyl-ACP methyl ester carboxylesterase
MGERFDWWRDPALGERVEVETSGGVMRAYDTAPGSNEQAIVFVHGVLVNPNLWRKVVARLAPRHRCVCLELPLGSHELPMPDADLSPTGLADLIAEAIGALGLSGPTIVANDTGGGLTQIALGRHPDLAGKVVLTSCDAYDNFPPRFFNVLLYPLRFPALGRRLFSSMRFRSQRNSPIAFGGLMHTKLEPEAGDSYVMPLLTSKATAADLARVLRGLDPKYTMEAIERLRSYRRPLLLAWSADDKFFDPPYAERLAKDIPGARLEWIEDARSFSAEDQPERLAELIGGFVSEPTAA